MLPKIRKGQTLDIKHFPTKFQALIFRLWENVPAKRLAEVLKTDEKTVVQLAKDMGLGEQRWLDEWMTRGYISILRHAWNILPYSQLCQLLDWSEERLDFILKEDDFLDIKLAGWDRVRTDCSEVTYRPLTSEEIAKTLKIKQTMEKEILPICDKDAEPPFSFFADRYAPIAAKKTREVTVDSTWAIKVNCEGVKDFVGDFIDEAKSVYGVEFRNESEKVIEISMDIKTEDEEYHEIEVKEGHIIVNAGTPVGVMRGLYFLLDLANGAGALSFDKKSYKRKTKIKTRFIYSFCGLYGDVLDKDSSLSFPDELLRGYARQGINGVWIQGVFYKIAPYPFDPEKCEGWEQRLRNLDEMTRRCARYGIKVYMYINEPRNMPLDFFEKRLDLKGTKHSDTNACLCSSHPETHKYLKDTIQTICKAAPLLGGFFNITQSENVVLCYSRGVSSLMGENNEGIHPDFCPVCGKRKGSEVTAEILETMANAAAEVDENIKFFAYAWAWNVHFEDQIEDLIARLPKNVIILQVSETGIEFSRGGKKNTLRDYSLSIVGPGEQAKDLWDMSRKCGLEVAAKVQVNNSWECSTAPFLPVYENVIQHMKNLIDVGIEHVMLSWTLGGYISDNIKIASAYFFEDTENSENPYDVVLSNSYGEYAESVRKAVNHFCKGFLEYPFDVRHIYDGPSNSGAANIIYDEPTGLNATMTCYPHDDLKDWCGPVYTPEILEGQYVKLCEEWEKGLACLEDMPVCEFKDMATYGYTLFKASLNQIRYYMLRDGKPDKAKMDELVRSDKELALMAYEILLRNSAVGYEAANHYYVTRTSFMEKVINCDYLLEN
ncbi:MAG: hypothetical protein J6Q10_03150 [Clostridia bacterium]|nr:hypothetical protein [Clostridia bacterium]